jgi:thiamine biosynthesis lipoprotein
MDELHAKFRALGSPCEIHLHHASREHLQTVMNQATAELARIEQKYSRYRDDSALSELNQSAGNGKWIPLDDETISLLQYADTAFRESGGLFDITSGVLRRVWDFKAQRVPSQEEVRELLPLIGWRQLRWRDRRLQLPTSGMEIDFGGFGKEYAADRVAQLCREAGIGHGLVDLGGDLSVVGPHPDGSPWRVGIRDPRAPERAMASLPLSRGGLATSGDYERAFVHDGRRYSHLLDPRTGWPVEGLASVSVVASHCLIAGTATTVSLLKGAAGKAWLEKLGVHHLWVDGEQKRGGSLWRDAAGATKGAAQRQGAEIL